jgi:hypothetical protein
MECTWERHGNQLYCTACRRRVRTDRPPEQVHAVCKLATKKLGLCGHLGDVLRVETCTTCAGNVRKKIYQCVLLSKETTIGGCNQCPKHTGRRKTVASAAPGSTPAASVDLGVEGRQRAAESG